MFLRHARLLLHCHTKLLVSLATQLSSKVDISILFLDDSDEEPELTKDEAKSEDTPPSVEGGSERIEGEQTALVNDTAPSDPTPNQDGGDGSSLDEANGKVDGELVLAPLGEEKVVEPTPTTSVEVKKEVIDSPSTASDDNAQPSETVVPGEEPPRSLLSAHSVHFADDVAQFTSSHSKSKDKHGKKSKKKDKAPKQEKQAKLEKENDLVPIISAVPEVIREPESIEKEKSEKTGPKTKKDSKKDKKQEKKEKMKLEKASEPDIPVESIVEKEEKPEKGTSKSKKDKRKEMVKDEKVSVLEESPELVVEKEEKREKIIPKSKKDKRKNKSKDNDKSGKQQPMAAPTPPLSNGKPE